MALHHICLNDIIAFSKKLIPDVKYPKEFTEHRYAILRPAIMIMSQRWTWDHCGCKTIELTIILHYTENCFDCLFNERTKKHTSNFGKTNKQLRKLAIKKAVWTWLYWIFASVDSGCFYINSQLN